MSTLQALIMDIWLHMSEIGKPTASSYGHGSGTMRCDSRTPHRMIPLTVMCYGRGTPLDHGVTTWRSGIESLSLPQRTTRTCDRPGMLHACSFSHSGLREGRGASRLPSIKGRAPPSLLLACLSFPSPFSQRLIIQQLHHLAKPTVHNRIVGHARHTSDHTT